EDLLAVPPMWAAGENDDGPNLVTLQLGERPLEFLIFPSRQRADLHTHAVRRLDGRASYQIWGGGRGHTRGRLSRARGLLREVIEPTSRSVLCDAMRAPLHCRPGERD